MKAFTKDLAGAFCNPTSLREMTRKLNRQGVVNPDRGGKKMKGRVAGLFLAGVLVVVTALSLWGGAMVAAPEDKDVTAGTIILAESDDYQELTGSFRLAPLPPGAGPVPASSKIKTLGPIFLKPASPTFRPQSASDAPGFNVSGFSSGYGTSDKDVTVGAPGLPTADL